MTQQAHGLAVWTEQTASASAITPAVWRKDGGFWELTTSGVAQGQMIDPGDGSRVLFDISTPFVLVSDGAGGLRIDSSGTAAAVLADDGAGGLVVSTDLTAEAGQLYPDGGAGAVWAVRDDADTLDFALIGDHYQSY